jgi:hypothetical protein
MCIRKKGQLDIDVYPPRIDQVQAGYFSELVPINSCDIELIQPYDAQHILNAGVLRICPSERLAWFSSLNISKDCIIYIIHDFSLSQLREYIKLRNTPSKLSFDVMTVKVLGWFAIPRGRPEDLYPNWRIARDFGTIVL